MTMNKKNDYVVHDATPRIGLDVPLDLFGCACAVDVTLRRIHIATCLFHFGGVILAIVFLAMGDDWSIPVVTSFGDWRRRDPTIDGCRDDNCFVTPAHGRLGGGRISLQGLVVAFHGLSFAWQFAVLVDECGARDGIRARYLRQLQNGRNGFRWTEYALSAPLMTIVIAVIFGIVDFYALLALAACTSALQFFGYAQEVFLTLGRKINDPFVVRSPIIAGFVFWIAYWSVIATAFHQSISASRATPSPLLTGLIGGTFGVMTFMYASFAGVLAYDVSRKTSDRNKNYANVEGWYCVLSLLSKWSLGAFLASIVRVRATVIGLGFVVDAPCAVATTNVTTLANLTATTL